jgi:hypothetical protein
VWELNAVVLGKLKARNSYLKTCYVSCEIITMVMADPAKAKIIF